MRPTARTSIPNLIEQHHQRLLDGWLASQKRIGGCLLCKSYNSQLFSKSLEIGAEGKHKSEGEMHNIIMPRKKDSEELN